MFLYYLFSIFYNYTKILNT